jgi:hypothetical protein
MNSKVGNGLGKTLIKIFTAMNEGKFTLAKQLWSTKVAVIKKCSKYFDNSQSQR